MHTSSASAKLIAFLLIPPLLLLAQGPSADVPKDKTAFAPANLRPGESPLQILDDRPVFLQSGGGFDALMQSLTMQPMNMIQQMPQFR